MQRGLSLPVLLLLLPFLGISQTQWPLSLTWQNNQTTKPFSNPAGFFKQPIHSGVTLGTAFDLNRDTVHQLLQTAKVGYIYHRNSQKAFQLYSEFMYRYRLNLHWSGIARVGAGYMHAFPDMPTFSLQNGRYEQQANTGRPQLMFTTSLGIQFIIFDQNREALRLRLTYSPWFQYPFVNEYVPLLPYTALNVGIEKPIRWNN